MSDFMQLEAGEVAARIVADLMPIAVAVCGPGEDAIAAALQTAGAAAETFSAGGDATFDLAVLLAATATPDPAHHGAAVTALAAAADRVLFVPVPLGHAVTLNVHAWFELFADQGFQPVVDYDAGFLGPGAFLVDREAIAAEAELADFAERVSSGAAPAEQESRERDAIQATLASREAELATIRAEAERWRARAVRAEADAEAIRLEFGAWEALGRWVWAICAAPGRDTLAGLQAAGGARPRRRLFGKWRRTPARPSKAERVLLADAALVRGSEQFDAAWYIASHPELADKGGDPVWHYVLRGAAAGAEPGPYFDSKPWREKYPDRNPLAEAVRRGDG